jgi:hypothetical protein
MTPHPFFRECLPRRITPTAGVPVSEAARRKGVARSTLQKFLAEQRAAQV